MRLIDLHPVACAGCGLVDRGNPDEVMTGVYVPTRGFVWVAHRDCAFREFRIARRQLLPIVRAMRDYDRRPWDALRERLSRDTRRRPAVFTEAVQDMFQELMALPSRTVCRALEVSDTTFWSWIETVVAVLRRFNLEVRPAVPVEGPKLALVSA